MYNYNKHVCTLHRMYCSRWIRRPCMLDADTLVAAPLNVTHKIYLKLLGLNIKNFIENIIRKKTLFYIYIYIYIFQSFLCTDALPSIPSKIPMYIFELNSFIFPS